ncbi:unnamed protein product [Ascophyllum nodosum]
MFHISLFFIAILGASVAPGSDAFVRPSIPLTSSAPNVAYPLTSRPMIRTVAPRSLKMSAVLVPANPSGVKAPPDMYQNAVNMGEKKAAAPAAKTFLMGIISGSHIAFGALLAITVGGNCPGLTATNPGLQKIIFGAFGLPFGLFMTVVGGGELFTGNTAMVTAAKIEGKASVGGLLKNWISSYLGNFAGSLLMVFLALQGSVIANPGFAMGVASAKTSLTFVQAFTRGIMCNWLVCMAVWMSAGANDAFGKFCAIFLPISAFVAMGLDHSVANMFLIPLGMGLGAGVSWSQFLSANLLPVTLGNIVGGTVAVCGLYAASFGSLFSKKK